MHETLFASTEGRMLGIGLALTGLMLLAFGIGWHLFPDSVLTYAAMTGLNLVIGRAAGMSFGYASGLGHAQVVPLNMLVETIQVLVVYPLFALSWRQLIRVPRLQPFVKRMHHSAESQGGGGAKIRPHRPVCFRAGSVLDDRAGGWGRSSDF